MAPAPIEPDRLAGLTPPAVAPRAAPGLSPGASTAGGAAFRDVLGKYLHEVDRLQTAADAAVGDLATGRVENLHQVVVAINEADLSFRLMMQVRNRLLEAYREIMRMQV